MELLIKAQRLGRMLSATEWRDGAVKPLNQILLSHAEDRQRYFSEVTHRKSFVERNGSLSYNSHYESGLALAYDQCRQLIG